METQFDDKEKVSLFDFIPEIQLYGLQDWDFQKKGLLTEKMNLRLFIELGRFGFWDKRK